MRLDRYLANLQYGTRSDVKKNDQGQSVGIDGQKVRNGSVAVAPGAQVTVDGEVVGGSLQVYYLMNKPAGS